VDTNLLKPEINKTFTKLHIPYTSLKLSFKIDLYLQYVSTKTAIIRPVI